MNKKSLFLLLLVAVFSCARQEIIPPNNPDTPPEVEPQADWEKTGLPVVTIATENGQGVHSKEE